LQPPEFQVVVVGELEAQEGHIKMVVLGHKTAGEEHHPPEPLGSHFALSFVAFAE
jgi:hypothetical protein